MAAAERSVFAIYAQELENCVLDVLREFFTSQGIDVYALIFDGLITSACSDELLRGAEAFVFERSGFKIQLAEKPLYGLQNAPIKF